MAKKIEKEFELVAKFIKASRNATIGYLNYASLATYWMVGAFISFRLKNGSWGDKSVESLCDFLKTRNPKLRGFSRRQIYNMIAFYDIYSSTDFKNIFKRLRLDEFVQSPIAQIEMDKTNALKSTTARKDNGAIVQSLTAQLGDNSYEYTIMPQFLALTTFTNHTEIIGRCRSMEEKVFYILYSAHERLKTRELRRAIATQTYESIMSKEKKASKALREKYPDAEFMLKDRAFLDFLDLPEKHNEHHLHSGILENMKKFILELGKDFLYMGDEYEIQVGGRRRRLDLLFYHRALRCLVDVELKSVPFEPEFVGKMDFYLSAIDHEIKREDENPSVGIILCPSAKRCEVKYAIDRTMSPIMIAEYKRLLIPEEVMKRSLEEYCKFMKKEECGK
jgi:predicted nuclease of restriction endonuclease-like (RecB) superfamily